MLAQISFIYIYFSIKIKIVSFQINNSKNLRLPTYYCFKQQEIHVWDQRNEILEKIKDVKKDEHPTNID
jgi:hypothetical protein